MRWRDVDRKLRAAGFRPERQRGSHTEFRRDGDRGARTVIVPRHSDIDAGTLASILRQAGITRHEFDEL